MFSFRDMAKLAGEILRGARQRGEEETRLRLQLANMIEKDLDRTASTPPAPGPKTRKR